MRTLLIFLSFLFISCDEVSSNLNISQENINFSDCYSLNEDQCQISNECKIWRSNEDIKLYGLEVYGVDFSTYTYDGENLCMDLNNSIYVGCIKSEETISWSDYMGVFLDDVNIFQNIETKQFIAINKIGYWLIEHNNKGKLQNWQLDKEAWNELVNYMENIPEEEKFRPEINELYLPQYPKYCGWEPNTSKEIE
jgi:hypothetical protein